jgi:hypothetical protein
MPAPPIRITSSEVVRAVQNRKVAVRVERNCETCLKLGDWGPLVFTAVFPTFSMPLDTVPRYWFG